MHTHPHTHTQLLAQSPTLSVTTCYTRSPREVPRRLLYQSEFSTIASSRMMKISPQSSPYPLSLMSLTYHLLRLILELSTMIVSGDNYRCYKLCNNAFSRETMRRQLYRLHARINDKWVLNQLVYHLYYCIKINEWIIRESK